MPLDVMQSIEIIEVLENYINKIRTPENIRHQVDIGYKTENQSVIIFELRPVWKMGGEMQECNVAKATFVKASNCWKVFWQHADDKWYSYPHRRRSPDLLPIRHYFHHNHSLQKYKVNNLVAASPKPPKFNPRQKGKMDW